MEKTIKLNPQFDQLMLIEHELRTKGAWHDVKQDQRLSHYFVARNTSVNTAISRCGSIVTTFDKLNAPLMERKCLICALYADAEQEVEKKKDNNSNTTDQ